MNDYNLFNPPYLYRFFDQEEYAQSFMQGSIYVGTLKKYRNIEDSSRGDRGEGAMHYRTGHVTGDGDNPDFQKIASRVMIRFAPTAKNGTLVNCARNSALRDAFILCTSLKFSEYHLQELGSYCVKINNPRRFFDLLTMRLLKHIAPDLFIRMDKIIYADREYSGLEDPPGSIGFVKPLGFSPQTEARMLWQPTSPQDINPIILKCPEILSLCERIK